MTRWIALLTLLLSLSLPMSLAAAAAPAPLVAGEDYVLVDDGQPWQPLAGRIEVVEVFAYWCPHCAEFQPLVEAWARKLPHDVRFSYLPAAFDPGDSYARAYFAALDLHALPRLHDALFDAVHATQLLARNATVGEIAWFFGQQGVPAERAIRAMTSAATDRRLQQAHDFELRSGVEGTPTLLINGRYRVQGRDHEDLLRNADALIAQLRANKP